MIAVDQYNFWKNIPASGGFTEVGYSFYTMKIQINCLVLFSLLILLLSSGPGHSSTISVDNEHLSLAFFNEERPSYFLIVDKSKQQLHLYEQTQSVRLLRSFVCATGENPGTKKISGDSKTPVGLYFITEVYEDKKITVFGSRAYHLDYPNIFDKHAGHQGNGIFIHGTNKLLIPYSTNGCITLTNPDLDILANYLSVDDIPVIVVEDFSTPLYDTDLRITRDDPRFKRVLRHLAIQTGDSAADNLESLSFLSLGKRAIASISYKVYAENSLKYRFKKRAYLTLNEPGSTQKYHTLYAVESQDTIPTILAFHPVKYQIPDVAIAMLQESEPPPTTVETIVPAEVTAVVTAAVTPITPPATPPVQDNKTVSVQVAMGEELLAFVDKWKTAWTGKDIKTYIDCYSPTFKSGQHDRNSWRKKKSYLNAKYAFIEVAIQDIAIEWTDAGANVSFFQAYKSDQYQTSGTKLLQLVNRDNRWMIQREVM